jgi:hypothetical protein
VCSSDLPIEASKTVVCDVRNTSTPDVRRTPWPMAKSAECGR